MKRGWLVVGALGALTLMAGNPAHAQSENSLGYLLKLATGIVIPNNGNNWVNRDGANEYAGETVTAVELTAGDGLAYQGGGLFQASSGLSAYLGNISGNQDLELVNYQDGNVGGAATIFGPDASTGATASFSPVGNPFALAAKNASLFSSTKGADSNPAGIGALIFRVLQDSSGAGGDPNGPGDIAGTSVLIDDYLIGWEDATGGDPSSPEDPRTHIHGDYQDYITRMRFSAPIPEPAFYQMSALLLLGGVGVLRLRRRKSD